MLSNDEELYACYEANTSEDVINYLDSINIKDYNILMIKNFTELVDVRDNLRLPIMFYRLKNNDVAHFYVLKDNHLYLYTINKKEMVATKKAKL